MNRNLLLYPFFCLLISASLFVHAETKIGEIEEDPDKDLPKSGMLSTTFSESVQNKSVPLPWNKKGAAADAEAPIAGSVSKISDKQWKMLVINNTDDVFTVSVTARQLGSRGNSLKTDSYSLRLSPKSQAERMFSAVSNSSDAELELTSWKRIVKAKPEVKTLSPEQSPTGVDGTIINQQQELE